MSSYKIYINDLNVEAIIGILEKERIKKQKIIVNVVIEYIKEDDYFINYAYAAQTIEELLIKKQYKLLEEAAEDISMRLKEDYLPITSIKLKISKPDILDNCMVAVEIFNKY